MLIIVGEVAVFLLQSASKEFGNREKAIITGDCCYINPLVRRTVRFLGVYAFGLFATDIFVNAGQVVTGNLAPHFLTVCKPNYTALGCHHEPVQFINSEEACTGNIDAITKARKTFPSKEAALSVYAAVYLAMYITCTVKTTGTRLAKPLLCLGLMCLAFLTGINRVAEYRNHWSDVVAGFIIGTAVGVFLVAVSGRHNGEDRWLSVTNFKRHVHCQSNKRAEKKLLLTPPTLAVIYLPNCLQGDVTSPSPPGLHIISEASFL
ncbi:phospholipid phosphatase-related protein type 5a isoform X3 [Hemitrygon akajei]|uniref:phospholipid phosphatase-related protein type 5a isoform X3 n=1 Tax=Hemitrygon akajei TaxID=2704970 RepID=UPI003BF9EB97